MAEKLDFAELERECQAAVAFSEGADCYQRDILQLIGHIRELERDKADWLKANAPGGWIDDLRRASQPGSGEAVSGAEWLALANQAHALKSSRETENESRYRFLRAQYIAADFDWNGEAVLIFRIPASTAVSADCDSTVDAARASLDGRREG